MVAEDSVPAAAAVAEADLVHVEEEEEGISAVVGAASDHEAEEEVVASATAAAVSPVVHPQADSTAIARHPPPASAPEAEASRAVAEQDSEARGEEEVQGDSVRVGVADLDVIVIERVRIVQTQIIKLSNHDC
jgi:hypothetical protein